MIGGALLSAIRFYARAISPALPPRCRFYPTCSAYAAEAVERHGTARGTWLALRRLVKCAPCHPGGVDLVPGSEPLPGTAAAGHSSNPAVAPDSSPVARAPRSASATPPASCRARQEESSVV